MSEENNKKPKTGAELIKSFFKKLNEDKDQYSCPEIIDIIISLHNKGNLSSTNISNALDEIRSKNNAEK